MDNNIPPVVVDPVNPTNNVAPKFENWKQIALEARNTFNAFKELDTLERVTVIQKKVADVESNVAQALTDVESYVTQALNVLPQLVTLCVPCVFFS